MRVVHSLCCVRFSPFQNWAWQCGIFVSGSVWGFPLGRRATESRVALAISGAETLTRLGEESLEIASLYTATAGCNPNVMREREVAHHGVICRRGDKGLSPETWEKILGKRKRLHWTRQSHLWLNLTNLTDISAKINKKGRKNGFRRFFSKNIRNFPNNPQTKLNLSFKLKFDSKKTRVFIKNQF